MYPVINVGVRDSPVVLILPFNIRKRKFPDASICTLAAVVMGLDSFVSAPVVRLMRYRFTFLPS